MIYSELLTSTLSQNKTTDIPFHDIDFPSKIHPIGELLSTDLHLLRSYGLVKRVSFQSPSKDTNLMKHIHDHVKDMLRSHNLALPCWTPPSLELDPSEDSRSERMEYHYLPFRVAKTGSKCWDGKLIYNDCDATTVFHDFTHGRLSALSKKNPSPVNPDIGLLFLCEYSIQLFYVYTHRHR